MSRKKLESTQTLSPDTPISKPIPKLDDAQRLALGQTMKILVDVNLGNRGALDDNLDIWNAIFEMRSSPLAVPWEGAAHITTPTVFSAFQEFCSRTIGSCLLPRPYTCRGNDPISGQYAHAVEQFFNSEWDNNDCFDAYEEAILMGARDGTVIMECLYDLTTHEELLVEDEPVMDAMGQQIVGPDGNPETKKVQKIATFIDYDAPREVPRDLKSCILFPNFARTANSADGFAVKVWMTEDDMRKKVNAKIFDPDTAEEILAYTYDAQGEQASDPQGNSQYTISGMISVVDTSVAAPEGMVMNRGPVEMYRIHTNLVDLDDDGVPEENIIWVHYRSGLCPGAVPFDYYGGRPFFELTMYPRVGVFYGFAMPEIGRSTQEEVDTQVNSRLNLLDLGVKPPRYRTPNVRFRDNDRRWEPDVEVEVSTPNDYGFLATPRIPQESFQEEDKLMARIDRAYGSPQAAATGVPVGGTQQRSARAAQLQAQLQAMQANLVATRVRRWMLRILKYKHGLYLRYGKDQIETIETTQQGAKRVVLPKEVLGLDYTLGISGLGGALDKEGRRQDIGMLTQLLLETPMSQLFQGKLTRLWNLARLNIETYDVPDVTSFIGTLDEAMQQEQDMEKQAAQQQQTDAFMQILSHMSGKGGGAPSGGGGGGGKPALHVVPQSRGLTG